MDVLARRVALDRIVDECTTASAKASGMNARRAPGAHIPGVIARLGGPGRAGRAAAGACEAWKGDRPTSAGQNTPPRPQLPQPRGPSSAKPTSEAIVRFSGVRPRARRARQLATTPVRPAARRVASRERRSGSTRTSPSSRWISSFALRQPSPCVGTARIARAEGPGPNTSSCADWRPAVSAGAWCAAFRSTRRDG